MGKLGEGKKAKSSHKSRLVQKNLQTRLARRQGQMGDENTQWGEPSTEYVQLPKPNDDTKVMPKKSIPVSSTRNRQEIVSEQVLMEERESAQPRHNAELNYMEQSSSIDAVNHYEYAEPREKNFQEVYDSNDGFTSNDLDVESRSSEYMKFEDEVRDTAAIRMEIEEARSLAEEGPGAFQLLGCMGGVAMVLSSNAGVLQKYEELQSAPPLHFALVSFYVWVFGIFIVGLEGRAFYLDIASLHKAVSTYLKLFRFMWGRGLLYIFVGSLQFCLSTSLSIVIGGFMMIWGVLMFLTGVVYRVNLKRKMRLIPETCVLRSKFDLYDTDQDGYINSDEYRDFIIGIELSRHREFDLDAQFCAIDKDGDGVISFEELRVWVEAVNCKNRTLLNAFKDTSVW